MHNYTYEELKDIYQILVNKEIPKTLKTRFVKKKMVGEIRDADRYLAKYWANKLSVSDVSDLIKMHIKKRIKEMGYTKIYTKYGYQLKSNSYGYGHSLEKTIDTDPSVFDYILSVAPNGRDVYVNSNTIYISLVHVYRTQDKESVLYRIINNDDQFMSIQYTPEELDKLLGTIEHIEKTGKVNDNVLYERLNVGRDDLKTTAEDVIRYVGIVDCVSCEWYRMHSVYDIKSEELAKQKINEFVKLFSDILRDRLYYMAGIGDVDE